MGEAASTTPTSEPLPQAARFPARIWPPLMVVILQLGLFLALDVSRRGFLPTLPSDDGRSAVLRHAVFFFCADLRPRSSVEAQHRCAGSITRHVHCVYVILLDVNADTLQERGRFQAFERKSWNHRAVAAGPLYVRSDNELACYEP